MQWWDAGISCSKCLEGLARECGSLVCPLPGEVPGLGLHDSGGAVVMPDEN